jgi:hypothetical protein
MEHTPGDTTHRSPPARADGPRSWRTRLLWLVGLWCAGVVSTAVVVEIVRLGMEAAGLKTH